MIGAPLETDGGGGSLVHKQNQSNSEQNGENNGTENNNAKVIAGGNEPSYDSGKSGSWTKDGRSEPSGGGGNCNQKFTFWSLNCTNYSKGQWQSAGNRGLYVDDTVGVGGGSLANQQN